MMFGGWLGRILRRIFGPRDRRVRGRAGTIEFPDGAVLKITDWDYTEESMHDRPPIDLKIFEGTVTAYWDESGDPWDDSIEPLLPGEHN